MKHLAFACTLVFYAAIAPASPITMVERKQIYTVNADATYAVETLTRIRINDAQGMKLVGQIPLQYSTSLHALEVLEAFTTTRAGARIAVAAEKIFDQQLPASSGAPTFGDHKVRMVVFPALEPGAQVTLRFRLEGRKPMLPGVFSFWEAAGVFADIGHSEIILRAPQGLAIKTEARSFSGGEPRPIAPDMQEWRWALDNQVAVAPEAGSVNLRDWSPYVIVTTLDDYASLARAFARGADEASRVTPAIHKLAEELTQGITDRKAQAKALYEWVAMRVRYVNIVLGVGGFVPHDADAVLQALYGDCKDHAVLFEALLTARGIRSSQVLVHAGDSYFLPSLATAASFNHVITYLPEFDLFADSTGSVLPFGVLDVALSGKRALMLDDGSGRPSLKALPMPGERDSVSVRSEFIIDSTGALSGKTQVFSSGIFEGVDRALVGRMPTSQLDQIAARMLSATGQTGTGKYQLGDPQDLTRPFEYGGEVTLPAFVRLPGRGAFAVPEGLGRVNGVMRSIVQASSTPARKMSSACVVGGRREEITRITFPSNLRKITLPTSTVATSRVGRYESNYARESRTLLVTRTLVLEFKEPTCSPEDYDELRKLSLAIAQDMRSQFMYR